MVTTDKATIEQGMVVKVIAKDWACYEEQVDADYDFQTLTGILYGRVVANDEERLVIAAQFFHDYQQVRYAMAIPWATIELVEILGV